MQSGRIIGAFGLSLRSDSSAKETPNSFYLIEWKFSGGNGKNHFVTTIGENWTYEKYKECMLKCGFFDEFSGF